MGLTSISIIAIDDDNFGWTILWLSTLCLDSYPLPEARW